MKLLAASALLLLAAPTLAQSLSTPYTGVLSKRGNMFDVEAVRQLTITGFDVHFADSLNPAPCGTTCSVTEVEVYYTWEGHEGKEQNPSAWFLRGAVQHTISTGAGTPQPLLLPIEIDMPQDSKLGLYITSTGPTNSLTGLPNERLRDSPGYVGTSNTALRIMTGIANVYPFKAPETLRAWNGTVYYSVCGSGVIQNYCTAGTSSSGCQALLETSGVPSASSPVPFLISAPNVEGDKTGLFYFGTAGRIAQPWGSTSSFKCVAFPTLRGTLISSGGTAGACDGTFSYDINAQWMANPQQNPGPGVAVQAQLWYRDPAGPNPNTAFSDASEFFLCP